jgi:hypothetical protein
MVGLVRLIAKFIATTKGTNLQKSDPTAHALLVKWNRFQRRYENHIEHFLPRNGNHPDVTMKVLKEWNPKAKENVVDDVEIPVGFPDKTIAR